MVALAAKIVLVKVFLPLFLISGAILRPSFISLAYIILAFLCTYLPAIKANSPFPKITRLFTLLCVAFSLLTTLAQFGYQLYQHLKYPDDGDYIKERCNSSSNDDFWLRQTGFIRVPSGAYEPIIFRLFLPELLALLGSLVTFISCSFYPTDLPPFEVIGHESTEEQIAETETVLRDGQEEATAERPSEAELNRQYSETLVFASKRTSDAFIVLAVCVVGILMPSLLNAPYFLFMLLVMTWWSLFTPLTRLKFNAMKRTLVFFFALHFVLLYSYQMEFFQQLLPYESFYARLGGFYVLIMPNECEKWYTLRLNTDLGWAPFTNFAAILCFHYLLHVQYRWTMVGVKSQTTKRSAQPRVGDSSQEELLSSPRAVEMADVTSLQRITSEVMDRQKISRLLKPKHEDEPGFILVRAFQEFLYFCLYHCYVFALLAMMMWALLYHSIFGLIFLLLTCFLWALVNSRKWTFKLSPILLAYVEFLLLAQYVFSMNLHKRELGLTESVELVGFRLEQSRTDAFTTLLLKIILSLPLFVLLRLHLREDYYNSLSGRERLRHFNYGTFTPNNSPTNAGHRTLTFPRNEGPFACISHLLTKYWIFLTAFCILVNSPINCDNVTLFSIGFLAFFIVFILLLIASFRFFRKVVFAFFTVLIIYASVVLLSIYCYQFKGVPEFWQNWTGVDETVWNDIGLIDYKANEFGVLFTILTKLISLLVVTMLQLKFFHGPWSKLVSDSDRTGHSDDVETTDEIQRIVMRASDLWTAFKEFCWRFAEVHIHRFVLLVLLVVCLDHHCFLNFVPVLFISVALLFFTMARFISLTLCLYLGLLFIAKKVYQLSFIPRLKDDAHSCINNLHANGEFNTTEKWIGIGKEKDVDGDVVGFITVLILIGMQFAIKYRQMHHRKRFGCDEPSPEVFFVGHNPRDFDKSLRDCAKFFLNYGFYKFGVETSFISMALAAWYRMDMLGAMLMVWLLVLVPMRRGSRKKLWPFLLIYLAVLLPAQYAMSIGLPSNLCIVYPWSTIPMPSPSNFFEKTLHFLRDNFSFLLSLANYNMEAHRFDSNILLDFFVLAIVSAQSRVFDREGESHPARSNESIYKNGNFQLSKENPHYDFVVEQRSFVDFFKYIIFMFGHWLTLVMVLCAGLGGTSLFATLARWNFLAIYSVVVMFCKVSLQLLGCVFVTLLFGICPIQQLFAVFLKTWTTQILSSNGNDKAIENPTHKEAMIGYDVIAFVFIVFQLRILHSWFFQRCMIEFRCEVIQANRGAILINQLIEKEMREQTDQQNKKLHEIKDRTAAIRKRYEEQQKRSTGITFFSPQTYGQAKRSGDYYMFDYEPDTDELVVPIESFVPEVTPGASDFDKLDPAQLLHTALGKGLNWVGTLDSVEQAEHIKDEELRMIAAVGTCKKAREIAKTALKRQEKEEVEDEHKGPSTSGEVQNAEDETDVPSMRELPKKSNDENVAVGEDEKKEAMEKSEQELRAKSWGQTIGSLFLRSREHRYVEYVLNKEKEKLKEMMSNELFTGQISTSVLRDRWEAHNMHLVSSEADIKRLEDEAHNRWEQRNIFARFITAIGNSIAAHTDIICYCFVVIVHGYTAGLLTLPLPALVFFWGTLASPRPSKLFWIVMIIYTEFEIVTKFAFQFGFWPWNASTGGNNRVYKTEYVFGVQRIQGFAVKDVALLIALFFHRYMLRKFGLWRDASSDRLSIKMPNKPSYDESSDEQSPHKSTLSTDVPSSSGENFETMSKEQQQSFVDIEKGASVKKRRPSFESAAEGSGKEVPSNAKHENAIEPMKRNSIFGGFVQKLIYPKFRYIRDLYPLMFFLDVLCMLIVVFGYSSFGEGGTGDVVSDIQSNRIPIMMVAIILLQSLLIVIDRGLYLRKAVVAKLIYHLITLVLVHVWIFFILPSYTRKEVFYNYTAKALYFVKCIYFLISAWQIRNGYPSLCVGNLLTHSYGLINMILFKIFMLTPFVFELRTAIDWTWTDTSMPIFDFFNMENFYAVIYNLKCARTFELAFPAPRGEAKGAVIKYMMGLPFIIVLILLVWSPIIAFALINTIGKVQAPDSVTLTAGLEGYPSLYKMEAQGSEEIKHLEYAELEELKKKFGDLTGRIADFNDGLGDRVRMAVAFINQYSHTDVLKIRFRPESETSWQISAESLEALKAALSRAPTGRRTRKNIPKHSQSTQTAQRSFVPLKKTDIGPTSRMPCRCICPSQARAKFKPLVFCIWSP
uniref:Piezo-type mechanosensitive ion channel component n=1 Tax=Globodera rostochiensis TaxID=31243 RepID=A0A914I9J3_GLORO